MIMLKFKSFFRTIKVEEVYMFEYNDFEEAVQGIGHFIKKVAKLLKDMMRQKPHTEEFLSVKILMIK